MYGDNVGRIIIGEDVKVIRGNRHWTLHTAARVFRLLGNVRRLAHGTAIAGTLLPPPIRAVSNDARSLHRLSTRKQSAHDPDRGRNRWCAYPAEEAAALTHVFDVAPLWPLSIPVSLDRDYS